MHKTGRAKLICLNLLDIRSEIRRRYVRLLLKEQQERNVNVLLITS